MKRAFRKAVTLAVPAILVCLVSMQLMCREGAVPPKDAQSSKPLWADTPAKTTPAATVPERPTSVRVCLMMVAHKEFGLLAHLLGKKDCMMIDKPYCVGKSWWDNPMVIHEDAPFPNSPLAASADSAPITGRGKSANMNLDMTLIPHADVTLKSSAACDCIKGTITATITASSDYYDGKWAQVVETRDKAIAFTFDTSDKSRLLRPTISETRAVAPFSFERYVRDHEKWEPKSAWPQDPKSGDWRCKIDVKDVKLVMTGYQYVERAPTTTPN